MNLELEWFDSLEEADKADRAYRLSLSPQERLEILLNLIRNYYGPSKGLARVYTIVELERS